MTPPKSLSAAVVTSLKKKYSTSPSTICTSSAVTNQKPARSSAGVQDFRPDAPEAARTNA